MCEVAGFDHGTRLSWRNHLSNSPKASVVPAPESAKDPFQFRDPGVLRDEDLHLILEKTTPADPRRNYVPSYEFKICVSSGQEKVGHVNFRAGSTPDLVRFGGHLGYGVDEAFRGRRLAERACRLLIPFIREHGLKEIWITCNPDNWASRRTCERLGAELVEIVPLPESNDMYKSGDRYKCRYRLSLV